MKRNDCYDRVKQAAENYNAAVHAIEVLIEIVVEQPILLSSRDLDLAKMRFLVDNLHDVYFVQMFAVFESIVRHFWTTTVRDSRPLTKVLLTSVASRRRIPQDMLDAVQSIREFRNQLVHEEHNVREQFAIESAFAHLNRYLAWLPLQW